VKLPAMNVIKRKTEGVNRFSGLDMRPKPFDSAFSAMTNMTNQKLPVMAARKQRTRVRTLRYPGGLFAHGALCWVDGTGFYYNGQRKGTVTQGEKRFVRMGAYVLIWPDGACYNTATDEFTSLNRTNTTRKAVTAALCRLDGEPYLYTLGDAAPRDPANGEYWMDQSVTPNELKMWSDTQRMWVSIPTVYTKISSEGIGIGFQANDAVSLRGFVSNTELNGSFNLVEAADNYIMVVALIPSAGRQTESVTIERTMPEMDFVCEAGNRVWGCSNATHEIYASALGDPTNWKRFLGLASDSYAVTVGTAGDFTGAASHLGNPVFFKEDVVHQLLGAKPADFSLVSNTCRGVARGSEGSLCHVNEYLLYNAPLDVCMMGMSTLPATVSEMLGKTVIKNAVAGALGNCYYLCAEDGQGRRSLYVYDTAYNAWAREDDVDITHFAQLDGELYMLTADGEIWSVNGTAPEQLRDATYGPEAAVNWELITGPLGLDEPYSKYISSIQLHVACDLGSTVHVDVRYDAEEEWQELFKLDPVLARSMTIPVVPRRCRTMRLRIRGTGAFELYSINKTIEQGSDVYAYQ